jgi:two-component system chemotaxis response regulator CheB
MSQRKIQVLVVEDSPTLRQLLTHILSSDPGIEVLGTAGSGLEALDFLARKRPDVILADIHMPGMDGFELTRSVMASDPIPIIIVSATWKADEVATVLKAMEAGAVAMLGKPRAVSEGNHEARELIETVKTMSQVKMVRRWLRPRPPGRDSEQQGRFRPAPAAETPARAGLPEIRLVAIGASTGGPLVLQAILARLGSRFPVPLLIVLHIAEGFLAGFVKWLEETTNFPCRIAEDGAQPLPGHAYLAPDQCHLGLAADGRIALGRGAPDNGLRPSVAHLFRSVARSLGANAAGVLLTGMGRDGADELKLMHEKGALTIAQDQESCIVFGMPAEAVKLDAATYVLNPEGIADTLKWAVRRGQPPQV